MSYALPAYIEWVLNRIHEFGHEAFVVGGCVRDMLMNRTPHDWDVCTDALPGQIARCFQGNRVIETGLQHGTLTIVVSGMPVEITTYRLDGQYSDHRRPDAVTFTPSLREDLARRDFTINAMAYRVDTGIIDYFGGERDIKSGIIRCVGDPGKRIEEDALRIMRALRFSTRYCFAIEPETGKAMLERRDTLSYVAGERILAELCRIDFSKLEPEYFPILQAIIPELHDIKPQPELPEDPALRLTALLLGLDAGVILKRFHAANALIDRVTALSREMQAPPAWDLVSVRQLLRRIGPDAASQLFILLGDTRARSLVKEITARGDCYSLKALAIDGNDMAALGLKGKAIGLMLNRLLTLVVEERLPNERSALIRYCMDHLGGHHADLES